MKLNLDLKAKIEEMYENRIPVRVENDCFTTYIIFKVTTCITSPQSNLTKHISILPEWNPTLSINYKDKTSGLTLIEVIQLNQELIIASDGSKIKCK